LPCLHLKLQCRQLLSQRAFDSSYTSISASGARYLADNTQVALVGIDYLSIGMYDEIGDAHRTLLGKVCSGYNRGFVL
jgi:kynurenine formamidase